jgi:ATP-dependent DNA helicase MPH1
MKLLISKHASFRVLALTATPGSDITSVANVVQNLIITHIEVRTEDSIDISKYIHSRSLELIVVPISEDIKKLTDLYCTVMKIYLKKLNDQNVYRESNPLNVSNFAILKAREAFRRNGHSSNRPPQLKGYIEGVFGVAQTLAIAYSNLIQHGINLFYTSLAKYDKNRTTTNLSKAGTDLSSNSNFTHMMSLIRELKEKPDFLSHLKMEKLLHVILEHFRLISDGEEMSNSRVIVFTQYRESVEEIVSLLNSNACLRVMSFVGQSTGNKGTKGLSQKEQLEVIRKFKAGNYNVLVCTSIGEEGLDIGEIDLIVCYDSQNSPIRMVFYLIMLVTKNGKNWPQKKRKSSPTID